MGILVKVSEEIAYHTVLPCIGFFDGSSCFNAVVGEMTAVDDGIHVVISTEFLIITGKQGSRGRCSGVTYKRSGLGDCSAL